MAEISPPTTRPVPPDPSFVRTLNDDKGTTRIVVIGASSGGGGGTVGKRENPPLPRGVP